MANEVRKLSKQEAINLTLEHWKQLSKSAVKDYYTYQVEREMIFNKLGGNGYKPNCFLCVYANQQNGVISQCEACPMYGKWGENGKKVATCISPHSIYRFASSAEASKYAGKVYNHMKKMMEGEK